MTLVAALPRRQRAYTMVEVMMALAVLATGATGIVAMQKAALIGNVRARNLSTANIVASTWMDRLKLDGLNWRKLAGGGDTLPQTNWLIVVSQDFPLQTGNENRWISPCAQNQAACNLYGYSDSADVRGFDTTNNNSTAYCTNVKLTQIMPNLIRAEVRTFWLRNQGTDVSNKYAGTINGMPLCSTNQGYLAAVGDISNEPRYHSVYMADAVLQTGGNL